MPDRDDINRDNATNKLLNILRTESSETGKGEKAPHSPEKSSGEESLDSKKLTALFDQTTSQKKGKPEKEALEESKPEQKKAKGKPEEKSATEDLSRFNDLEKIKADETEENKSREEKSQEEEPKEKENFSDKGDDTGLNVEAPKITLNVDKKEKKKPEQKPDKETEAPEEEKDSEDLNTLISDSEETFDRVGPFVEFKTRFEDRKTAPRDKDTTKDQEEVSAESGSLLNFLDKQPREHPDEEKEGAAGINFEGGKSSHNGKSIFDILDEYIATKDDDVVLPIKETEELSLETLSLTPSSEPTGDPKKKDDKAQETEAPVDKSLITEEEAEVRKSPIG